LSKLSAELGREPAWMYPWELGDLGSPPLLGPELPSLHRTRLELIEEPVREALARAGEDATVLDVGCSEGWFAHQVLDWGAGRVVGIDARAAVLERARLVRDHLGVPAERLELIEGDLFELDLQALGGFDVVLALGLVYHLEDPVGALRRLHRVTRRLCVIETQLTRQIDPLVHGGGSSGHLAQTPASFAALVDDEETNPVGSVEGVVNLIPNRAAVELAAFAAGFQGRWQPAADHHNEQYRLGDRGVLVARPAPAGPRRPAWPTFPGVPGRIHPNDDILYAHDSVARHYDRSGRAAVSCIEEVLGETGRSLEELDSVLDMACGYGRVLRLLCERVDAQRVTACDVTAEAVAFCAYEFGARPLLSDPEFEGVPFETYDLIWVGSLVTHLDERLLGKFTAVLPRLLRPGGLLMITTLGEFGIQDVSRYEDRLAGSQDELESRFRERGFVFVPYEGLEEGLGYAWHTPAFLIDAVEGASGESLRHHSSRLQGWDAHQDVISFRSAASEAS